MTLDRLMTPLRQAIQFRFKSEGETGAIFLGQVARGAEGFVVDEVWNLIKKRDQAPRILLVARDGAQLNEWKASLSFFSPQLPILEFPAWDCLPYDRSSPASATIAARMSALCELASQSEKNACIVLTTVNAIAQKLPPIDFVKSASLSAKPGMQLELEKIARWLEGQGYLRTSTVRDMGEFAQRGGIVDIFPPGYDLPIRLDFFGDTLETIRTFDTDSQRTVAQLKSFALVPNSEVAVNEEAIKRFRKGYISSFGAPNPDEPLYAAISAGHRYNGAEHWLPLFYDGLSDLIAYVRPNAVLEDFQLEQAWSERWKQINDYYETRKEHLSAEKDNAPYRPLPPENLYIAPDYWQAMRAGTEAKLTISPFESAESLEATTINLGLKQGRNFANEREIAKENIFSHLADHINSLHSEGKIVIITCWSDTAAERLEQFLRDRDFDQITRVKDWASLNYDDKKTLWLTAKPLEVGFVMADAALISEQDILGDRVVRRKRKAKSKASDILTELSTLAIGDYVVHTDHGIGRFERVTTVTAVGAPHDCLELIYSGGDKLYLPVENLELLSRYGSENTSDSVLDKLGGVSWQARKAKVKKRLLDMADKLVKIAAERMMKHAPVLNVEQTDYDEFSARFPYDETEDQLKAINDVLNDLSLGRPMDRLVCGDVGFGKTEVAIRAAFVAAMSGSQVALVVPTTLLARQHFANFSERLKGLPINVAQLSRLISSAEQKKVREGLKAGTVDIVIGTHALLAKTIEFKDLGLLMIDEEQRFGVKHKERLKDLRSEVHILTLTATPIPRTLQMSMTGIREMSLIATPPVDRLAVRSFVGPFDNLTLREALLREKYRGGQTYFVVPRLKDIDKISEFLTNNVPEVKFGVAHGQMPPEALDDIMTSFYEGRFDVLISTTIVESGIDVANANTLIVYKAEMFGLAQLYQLRGRVGRGKIRAFAYFTTPNDRLLTATAEKRLKVLQSLEGLGAGFTLASHDLDIRGGGNLLGEEQSGQIKEVGFELYQHMLEEAVASLKKGGDVLDEPQGQWSPQIQLGTSVVIPESYIEDLNLKLSLYRRLAGAKSDDEIDGIIDEMADRFGAPPPEVKQLAEIVRIKMLCRIAGIEKIDAGPKGALITFRNNIFARPDQLIMYIQSNRQAFKIRPDQRLQILRNWRSEQDRVKDITKFARKLAGMIEAD